LGKISFKAFLGDLCDRERLRRKVQRGDSPQHNLDVRPEIRHGIELKDASAVDRREIVVVAKIEDHILAEAQPHWEGEPHFLSPWEQLIEGHPQSSFILTVGV
jgi:hypothetical protein